MASYLCLLLRISHEERSDFQFKIKKCYRLLNYEFGEAIKKTLLFAPSERTEASKYKNGNV